MTDLEYDWAAARPFDGWTDMGPNISAPANRKILEDWLCEGIVFGLHSFYCGGCSPNYIAFKSLAALNAEVDTARQGEPLPALVVGGSYAARLRRGVQKHYCEQARLPAYGR